MPEFLVLCGAQKDKRWFVCIVSFGESETELDELLKLEVYIILLHPLVHYILTH